MHILSAIKKISLDIGVYDHARKLSRIVRKKERERYYQQISLYRSLFTSYGITVEGTLCFDVGSNIGEKSEALLALGCSVVSFEPNYDLADELHARAAVQLELLVRVHGAVVLAPRQRERQRADRVERQDLVLTEELEARVVLCALLAQEVRALDAAEEPRAQLAVVADHRLGGGGDKLQLPQHREVVGQELNVCRCARCLAPTRWARDFPLAIDRRVLQAGRAPCVEAVNYFGDVVS